MKTRKTARKRTKGGVQRQVYKLFTITKEGRTANADEQALAGYLHPYVQSKAQTMPNVYL